MRREARMARCGTLPAARLTDTVRTRLASLAALAGARGQSLAQAAIAWVLRHPRVTTAVVGARTVAQLDEFLDYDAAGPSDPNELPRFMET